MADVYDYVIYCRLSRTLLCLCAAVLSSVSAFRAEVRDPKVSELRVHILHSHDPEQIITESFSRKTQVLPIIFGNFFVVLDQLFRSYKPSFPQLLNPTCHVPPPQSKTLFDPNQC